MTKVYQQIIDPLLDDLDTPKCLAVIQKVIAKLIADEKEQANVKSIWNWEDIISQNEYEILQNSILKTIFYLDTKVFHFGLHAWVEALINQIIIDIPQDIQQLAQQRRDAKKARDFALADSLRDELMQKWWAIEDTKDGYQVSPIVS